MKIKQNIALVKSFIGLNVYIYNNNNKNSTNMRENISIYTRLRTVVTCTDRNVCNNILRELLNCLSQVENHLN
jgi:hypothetical protein